MNAPRRAGLFSTIPTIAVWGVVLSPICCNPAHKNTPLLPGVPSTAVLIPTPSPAPRDHATSFRWEILDDASEEEVRPEKEAKKLIHFSRPRFSSSACKTLEGSDNPSVNCSYKLKKTIKTCPASMEYITLEEAMNLKEDVKNVTVGAVLTTTYDRQVCDRMSSSYNNFPQTCQMMFRAQQFDGKTCHWTNLHAKGRSSFATKYYEQEGEGTFCLLEYTEKKTILLADFYAMTSTLLVYDICLLKDEDSR